MHNQQPPVTRREIFGWAMFDFANSSYTTIIITVFFSVYFTKVVVAGPNADGIWGLGIFITNLLVMLSSPLVGALADGSGRKKTFLLGSYVLCVGATAALFFATPGQIVLGLVLLVVSNVAFSFGENFAAAFLPEIATPEKIGRISAFGWGLGYFGGLVCLLLVRPLVAGLDLPREVLVGAEGTGALFELRMAWVVTAAFFLVAGLPTFLFLKERAPRRSSKSLKDFASEGFQRLGETARAITHFSELRRFLVIFFFYQAGLTTVVAFAGIFAERTLGFTTQELIVLFLMLQVASAAGALVFGWIQDRIGGRRSIQITLVIWVIVCVGSYFCQTKGQFWVLAGLAGLGIGSLQSASRAVVGLFSPREKSGEFFGFWGLAGKAAYMVGPIFFGVVSSLTGSQRTAILTTTVFFVIGLIGMAWVDEEHGHAEAARWHAEKSGATLEDPHLPSSPKGGLSD